MKLEDLLYTLVVGLHILNITIRRYDILMHFDNCLSVNLILIQINFQKLKDTCNLWRNWGDIDDSWASVTTISKWFGANQDRFYNYSGPGHWNDPDMVQVHISFSN